MDLFQKWVDFWNPIAKPTADLGAEAGRKFAAGEITQAEYLEAMETAKRTADGIAAAKIDYAEKAASDSLSLSPDAILKPVKDTAQVAIVAALLIGAAYLYFTRSRGAA